MRAQAGMAKLMATVITATPLHPGEVMFSPG